MVRDKSDKVDDGADESMLAGDDKAQLARKDEVKFIPADHTINGDAKIDIGAIDKVSVYCIHWRIVDMLRSLCKSTLIAQRHIPELLSVILFQLRMRCTVFS